MLRTKEEKIDFMEERNLTLTDFMILKDHHIKDALINMVKKKLVNIMEVQKSLVCED